MPPGHSRGVHSGYHRLGLGRVEDTAGVGKSAVAQTCSEDIDDSGRLGATFFFNRPNGWNDPKTFLPTIVYQLATRYPTYCDLIDAIILRDRLVLEKWIDIQFRELLVKPLGELRANSQDVGTDAIIIVDGLDECKTKNAQSAIIELVVTSIHEQTTPFLWAFFSRPEPHISSAFESELTAKVSWQLTLPVSCNADSDIEAYLRDGFRIICAKYGLPRTMAWPSDEDIRSLVDQSSGLFVYAVTIVRYISQGTGGVRLEEQLRSVLGLSRKPGGSVGSPLSKLDQFYMLIMKQIPEAVLPDTLSLLFLNVIHSPGILYQCSALGLSFNSLSCGHQ